MTTTRRATPTAIRMRIFMSFHHICLRTRLAPRRKPCALCARLSVAMRAAVLVSPPRPHCRLPGEHRARLDTPHCFGSTRLDERKRGPEPQGNGGGRTRLVLQRVEALSALGHFGDVLTHDAHRVVDLLLDLRRLCVLAAAAARSAPRRTRAAAWLVRVRAGDVGVVRLGPASSACRMPRGVERRRRSAACDSELWRVDVCSSAQGGRRDSSRRIRQASVQP